jgi:hypothetical protein
MSAREVIARDEAIVAAMARAHYDAVNNRIHGCVWPLWENLASDRREWFCADMRAALVALDAAGKVVVDRSVLIEARDEITTYVKHEYAGCEGYPSMERRMQRDLELARELGRLAAAKEGEP